MLSRLYGYAALVLGALAVALLLWCKFLATGADRDRLRADAAEARADTLAQQVIRADEIIKAERRLADEMGRIAEQYEREKRDAQDAADRLAADLRAGNVRLRDEWATCATDAVSEASRSSAELDAAAADRERLAAEIVQIGAGADAKIRGLQQAVRADRQ